MIETVLNIPASKNDTVSQNLAESKSDPWARLTGDIAKHADQDAFTKYYETFFDTMFITVKRATGSDEATCLDIVQDAMVKAIRKMKPMRSRDQTVAWTVVVAKTTAYDYLRKVKRRKQVTNSVIPEHAVSSDEMEIESIARLAWVEEQLQQLPAELSSMIDLKYRMGWTLRQIGEKFGLKTGAVDGKIRRAIEGLKAHSELDLCDE